MAELHPDADVTDGGWLNESAGSTLNTSIDEVTINDSDYIQSSVMPTSIDECTVASGDPLTGAVPGQPMTVSYRFKKGGTSGNIYLTVSLMQGATVIASWENGSIPSTFSTVQQTLTSGQFAAISDFTDLRLRFGATSQWWLANSAVDLWFETGQYYDGADGAAVTSLLSCSRASIAYAQTLAGTLTQFAVDTLRITDKGLLMEIPRTNILLWNQDLTNAAWTKTSVTATLDQTGPDGVANSATRLTATGANGTVLQAVTLGSSARYQSAWVKRITGSGTINMTMDNGSTWTAITVTSSWTLAEIPTQTLANPTCGFRIVTNGDEIAVDFVQNEDGVYASSPIPTTTAAATRASDNIILTGAANTAASSAAASVVISHAALPAGSLSSQQEYFSDSTANIMPIYYAAGSYTTARFYNGFDVTVSGLTDVTTVATKVGSAWNASGRSISAQGISAASDAVATALTSTAIHLGGRSSSLNPCNYIRRCTLWSSRLADATLQGFT